MRKLCLNVSTFNKIKKKEKEKEKGFDLSEENVCNVIYIK